MSEVIEIDKSQLEDLIKRMVKVAIYEIIADYENPEDTSCDILLSRLIKGEQYSHFELVSMAISLGLCENTAKFAISRLTQKKKLIRVSRGQYFVIDNK
jgi:hypothetical protein